MITKRGFEYIIQEIEPAEEDSGTEVLEGNSEGFEAGEYYLDVSELYNLDNDKEDWEATTIWWFRAICYDEVDTKYVGEWIKNVPTVTTGAMDNQLALNSIAMINAHGELIDKGANDITERGFRIIKEYQGDLFGVDDYISIGFGDYEVMVGVESHTVLGGGDGYTVVDYYWTGTFYRDSVEEGNFDLEEFERTLGGGLFGEGLGIYLKQNDTYLIQAIAKNSLGLALGEQVSVTTLEGEIITPEEDEPEVENGTAEITINFTVPEGYVVTRVGVRGGRTTAKNEIDVFEDGYWEEGEYEETIFISDLIPGEHYYWEDYVVMHNIEELDEIIGGDGDIGGEIEITEDYPDFTIPDWEDDTHIYPDYEQINYMTVISEIKCEKRAAQGFIDMAGRRRSETLSNHLIQTKEKCRELIDLYLSRFQEIKLKVDIEIDMPIPFEVEDIIHLSNGELLFKENGNGATLFKDSGEILYKKYILAKIRKIGATFESGGSTIIPIELEV